MTLLDEHNIPIGFGMALAENLDAMNYFAGLDNFSKQQVIAKSHQMHSKEAMHDFVSSLGNNNSYSQPEQT